ncbi:MAG: hypothetical protein ACRDSF_16525 [Pseudonocardiaceae bacterium]
MSASSIGLENGKRVDRGCGCRAPAGHQPANAGRLQASMVMHDPPQALHRCGLEPVDVWGGFDGSSYGLGSVRLMLLAEKP